MTEKQAAKSRPVKEQQTGGTKKPYVAPQILSLEPLEAVAAACAPGNAQFGKDLTCVQSQS